MGARGTTARGSGGRILKISIEYDSAVPLTEQIYAAVRDAIVSGRLRPGSAVPSSRGLAADLGVARSTVVLAFEQLKAAGYLTVRQGARARVSDTLPDLAPRADRGPMREPRDPGAPPPDLPISGRLRAAMRFAEPFPRIFSARGARPFRLGVPAFDLFPMEAWGRALTRAWRATSPRALGYGDARGHAPLRARIAEYVGSARGVRCTADQVVVTAGSQHALCLTAFALLEHGDAAWVEDPAYFGVLSALAAHGARAVPVPVDGDGVRVAEGRRLAPDARAAYVMPSRQTWLATSMSRPRRAELLRWAEEARAYLIEDDYGGEFYFGGRPLPALQADDPSGRVIYVGTFSKVMFPSLRLGYLVLPEPLVDAFGAARHATDLQSPYLEQAAMAEFMAGGHYERHVRRMRQAYHERQGLLVELARERLAGWLRVPPVEGGMACVGWLPPHVSDAAVSEAALADGVEVVPLSRFTVEHPQPPALLLGFSGVSTDEIRGGVDRLARTFERLEREGAVAGTIARAADGDNQRGGA